MFKCKSDMNINSCGHDRGKKDEVIQTDYMDLDNKMNMNQLHNVS